MCTPPPTAPVDVCQLEGGRRFHTGIKESDQRRYSASFVWPEPRCRARFKETPAKGQRQQQAWALQKHNACTLKPLLRTGMAPVMGMGVVGDPEGGFVSVRIAGQREVSQLPQTRSQFQQKKSQKQMHFLGFLKILGTFRSSGKLESQPSKPPLLYLWSAFWLRWGVNVDFFCWILGVANGEGLNGGSLSSYLFRVRGKLTTGEKGGVGPPLPPPPPLGGP